MSINLNAFRKDSDDLDRLTEPEVVMAALDAFWHRSDREELEQHSQLKKRMEAALAAAREAVRDGKG